MACSPFHDSHVFSLLMLATHQKAYAMARGAAVKGISLLPNDSWDTHHELTFRLHVGTLVSSLSQVALKFQTK